MSDTPPTLNPNRPRPASLLSQDKKLMWDRVVKLFVELPAGLAILIMMLHVTINAIGRSLFNDPVSGTLELSQYWYMPIIVLLGFVAAQHRNQHVAADVLFGLLPKVAQKWVLISVWLAASLVSLGFTWFSAKEAVYQASIGATAGAIGLPSWPVQFIVPIAFGVLTLQFLAAALKVHLTGDLDELDDSELAQFANERETELGVDDVQYRN